MFSPSELNRWPITAEPRCSSSPEQGNGVLRGCNSQVKRLNEYLMHTSHFDTWKGKSAGFGRRKFGYRDWGYSLMNILTRKMHTNLPLSRDTPIITRQVA